MHKSIFDPKRPIPEKLFSGMRVRCPSGRVAIVVKGAPEGRVELRYVGLDDKDLVTLKPDLLEIL